MEYGFGCLIIIIGMYPVISFSKMTLKGKQNHCNFKLRGYGGINQSKMQQDNSNKTIEQFNTKLDGTKNGLNKDELDLRWKEAIIQEKERFGRVRTNLMKYLRAEYGNEVADKALRRINK